MERLDEPAESGVLVMAFNDNFGYANRRWELYDWSCRNRVKHGSSSIINKAIPWAMRDLCKGAFIISPALVNKSITCGYAQDGNSLASPDGCGLRGSYPATRIGDAIREQLRIITTQKHCHLGTYNAASCYNEIIFRADLWYERLPSAVQAFVVDDHKWSGGYGGHEWETYDCASRGQVEWEHQQFLSHFAASETDIPLVYFDRRNLDAPFSWRPSQPHRRRADSRAEAPGVATSDESRRDAGRRMMQPCK